MPGVKGRSGGPRPKIRDDDRRGRPVTRRTLTAGDTFAASWHNGEGWTQVELWTVKELSRSLIILDDGKGGEYRLVK